jgi:DNA-binding transcriptional ArsR family regulator
MRALKAGDGPGITVLGSGSVAAQLGEAGLVDEYQLRLRGGERAASELAAPFDMTFAAISQHLKVLEEADLVSVRRDGRQRFYKLEPKPLRGVVSWIDEFAGHFGQRLDALGEYLDRKHGKKRG